MTPETTPPTSDTHDGSIKVRRLGRSLRSGAAALRRRGLWIVFGALGGIIGGTLVASHQKAPVITTHFYKATAELRLDTPAQTTQTVDPVRWSLQIAQLTIVSNPYRTAVAQQAGVGFYTVESTLVAIPFQDSATLDLTAVATDPDLAARLAYHAATELNPQMAKIVDQRHHDQVLNVYASLQSANTLVNALRRLVDTAPPSQREDLLAKLQAATSQVQLLTSQSFAITTKAPVFALSGPPQAIEINQTAYGTRWVLAANDVGAARINAAASLVNVNPQDTIAMQILIKTLSEETVLPSDKKPNPAQPIGLGLLAGLVLGLSGVVLGEAWDDHIHDSLAATRATGLGVIVEIPRMSKRRVRAVLAHDPDETNRSVVDARLRYVEAAWEIAAVLGIDPHRPIDGTNGTPGVARPEAPIVLVTSTAPAEGKTTSTAALAAAFGHLGFRALAVDGDYHHRSLRGLVRPVPHTGDPADPSPTMLERVWHLDDPASADKAVTSSAVAARLIRRAIAHRGEFDIILLDTPPVLATTDAVEYLQYADAAVLVVRVDRTPAPPCEQTANLILRRAMVIPGMILTDVPASLIDQYADASG